MSSFNIMTPVYLFILPNPRITFRLLQNANSNNQKKGKALKHLALSQNMRG